MRCPHSQPITQLPTATTKVAVPKLSGPKSSNNSPAIQPTGTAAAAPITIYTIARLLIAGSRWRLLRAVFLFVYFLFLASWVYYTLLCPLWYPLYNLNTSWNFPSPRHYPYPCLDSLAVSAIFSQGVRNPIPACGRCSLYTGIQSCNSSFIPAISLGIPRV